MRSELKEALKRIHSDDYHKMVETTKKVKSQERFAFLRGFWNGQNGKAISSQSNSPVRSGVIFFCVLLVSLVLLSAGIKYFNTFSHSNVMIQKDKSAIDIELERRGSLIPRLIAISTEYASHEKTLYKYVSEIRNHLAAPKADLSSMDVPSVEKLLSGLVAVAEQYPDLKATQSFEQLMKDWTETENRIAKARHAYMSAIEDFNGLCTQFPSNSFGWFFGFTRKEFFTYEDTTSWSEMDLSQVYSKALEQKTKAIQDNLSENGSASTLLPGNVQRGLDSIKKESAATIVAQPTGEMNGNR